MISSEQYNMNMIQLEPHEHNNPTILACNMMTLHAPFILLRLPRNRHMHHLPTSDITRSSQDQAKLGINNTIVIVSWPQGAWLLPMTLAQIYNNSVSSIPPWSLRRSQPDQHWARDPYDDDNPTNKWPVILTTITTRPINGPWSLRRSQPDQ